MKEETQKKRFQRELEQRPFKTQIIYENNDTVIDAATGAILSTRTQQKVKSTTEPDFIKIYYKSMLAVQGVEEVPLEFVLALSSVITYSNNPKSPVYFYNNAANRKIISECCMNKKGMPISDNMVARHINSAVKMGLLFKTQNRGIYEVNPCMIARGRWENIKGLQAKFDFFEGKWTRTILEDVSEKSKNEDEIA
jgi:hypothetical protein